MEPPAAAPSLASEMSGVFSLASAISPSMSVYSSSRLAFHGEGAAI